MRRAVCDMDLTTSDQVWQAVAERIESFVDAWDHSSHPPPLDDYLPEPGSAPRQFALVELIKIDLEHRLRGNHPVFLIEDYLREFPELACAQEIPEDLIYEEFHLRKAKGHAPTPAEYAQRFPAQAEQIRRLLEGEEPYDATSLRPVGRIETLEVGDTIDEFELVSHLGKGAFASVFLARQISMQRLVALKVSANRGREPQTLAQLDHPHIVRVYDQREIPARGLRLLYMQYVPGRTLQDAMESIRKLPRSDWHGARLVEFVDRCLIERGLSPTLDSRQREAIGQAQWFEVICILGAQIADALGYAADQQVLHRDLKPANILLSDTVSPKLVDFNISCCAKVEGATPASYFGGSLAYMSPEHLEAMSPRHARDPESLDARSDIYSLGIVLWELAMGSRPFTDELAPQGWSSTVENMIQRRKELDWENLDPSSKHPLPPAIRSVLLRCLAADASDRFHHPYQLAHELRLAHVPKAYSLLAMPPGRLGRVFRRWPFATSVTTVLMPNILAGWFNYVYNYDAIVLRIDDPSRTFQHVMTGINIVAFPAGIAIGLALVWPLAAEVRRRAIGGHAAEPSPQRLRCMTIGHHLAILCIVAWISAGLVYPTAMMAGGVQLSTGDCLHFFGSLLLCGLIGASYPFFGLSALAMVSWYPLLLQPSRRPDDQDLKQLAWLDRVASRYLIMAGAVPLLALGILTFWERTHNRLVLGVLSLGGLCIFGLVFALHRRIQSTLSILSSVPRHLSGGSQ